MEALIRWCHPEIGIVPPFDFIPLAEESGLIVPIGEWVIEEACRQSRTWQADGMRPVPVAVNVSSSQFEQKDFAGRVDEILKRTGIEPGCLELEMTESVLMSNVANAMNTLKRLKEMGIKISVDDFGTGYSSLSYLSKFPIDELKVDRSFVMHVPGNRNDATITAAIIALAHSLGLRVVAEGVETEEQADFLVKNGCKVMQGYLYSRPVPAAEIPSLVALGLVAGQEG
jgi:EAL domain-containing protein (putative c-di-GMP-specific phosphodiesterase class I)